MKKYIIIAGVPRSGKSTISQLISHEFGYQHISMDSIIAGIEKTFPETGINSEADIDTLTNIKNISSKMAPFIQAMIVSGEYNECNYGVVIDMFQILPQDFVQYIDKSVCDIYYFITSDVTPAERYEILKRYDTPKDYTFYKSDVEKISDCEEIVSISRFFKEQCEIYKLPYFETAYNREKLFNEFMSSLNRK